MKNVIEQYKQGNRNFSSANLRYANLSNANLSNVNLRYANLSNADLSNADLSNANLINANLSNANLSYVNLRYANLRNANLSNANLSNANLRYANLSTANLSNANLSNVKVNHLTVGYHLACPEKGSFIAFKKACIYVIEILVTEKAKRNSATTVKCRCSECKVLAIYDLDGNIANKTEVASNYDPSFVYRVGEIVSVKDFDEDRWNECSIGIHFFMSFELAKIWDS